MALPLELAKLHDVFHVSMLRRYRSDTSHILPVQDMQVQEDFTFDEEPKAILDREIRQLRNNKVPFGKSALATSRYGRSDMGTSVIPRNIP